MGGADDVIVTRPVPADEEHNDNVIKEDDDDVLKQDDDVTAYEDEAVNRDDHDVIERYGPHDSPVKDSEPHLLTHGGKLKGNKNNQHQRLRSRPQSGVTDVIGPAL